MPPSQDIDNEVLILMVHDFGQFRTGRERAVDVMSVVAVAAVSGSVVDGDDIAVHSQLGDKPVEQPVQVFGAEVVEDLAGYNEIVAVVGKFGRQCGSLDPHVVEFGDGVTGLSHGSRGEVDREQLVAAGCQRAGEFANRAAGLETVAVSLVGQRRDSDGALAAFVPAGREALSTEGGWKHLSNVWCGSCVE